MSETLFYNSRNLVGIGSVGIGLTNPLNNLHVLGGITGTYAVNFLQCTNGSGGALSASNVITIQYNGNKDYLSLYVPGNSGASGTVPGITLLATASTIAPNVGIGTTNPLNNLHVLGGITGTYAVNFLQCAQITGGALSASNVITIQYNGNKDYLSLYVPGNTGASGTVPGITLLATTSTTAPNVGIGTTNPSTLLHVYSPAGDNPELKVQGSGNGAVVRVQDSTGSGFMKFNNTLQFWSGSAIAVNITTSGNVGIGTASPSYKFHLDNTSSTGPAAFIQASAITAGQNMSFILGKTNTSYNAGTILWNHVGDGLTTNYLGLGYWGGDNKLNITAAGNVGIGTTSPNQQMTLYNGTDGTSFNMWDGTNAGFFQLSSSAGVGPTLYIKCGPGSSATGGVYLSSGATSWVAVSDIRLKNIIEPISNALAKVDFLNPVIYSLKDDPTNKPRPGLIAQDVLNAQPECVSQANDGMYGVSYTELIPLAFQAIKELSAQVKTLQVQVAALQNPQP